ncbi:uncharacterized protein LOC115720311 [Cannabis sativa]|uniref:uncharacterized protein LOC115720311 n=1 Tax=Cannabis sativa TaxID=3483 RepID=UPI0029CA0D3E|nr:uncharacterized protein LOC115720311 [Cannabis sativa]
MVKNHTTHTVNTPSILSNALPVRGTLARRINIDDETCLLCGEEAESIDHLFLYCNFAYHIWRSSPWGVYLLNGSGGRVWDWVKFLWNLKLNGDDAEKLFLYASIAVDVIWKTRNDKVHNSTQGNLVNVINSISHCYTDYASYVFLSVLPVVTPSWTPPPKDWIKINCDVKVGGDSMCIATLARDHSGAVVWAVTSCLNFRDPLIGEAAACQLALDRARLRKHDYVLVESDSEVVIKALKGMHYI